LRRYFLSVAAIYDDTRIIFPTVTKN